MFGFVKSWLRKSEGEIQPFPSAAQPKNSNGSSAQPAMRPNVAAAGTPAHRPATGAEVLELPFSAILGRLPADLQGRVKLPVNGQALVAVPLGVIVPQLGRGAVRISFGELREMAAELFYSQTDRDAAIVELSLAEILSRLDPALLPRRAQTAVAVPAEITSPFSEKGQGLNIYKPDAPATALFARKADESVMVPEFLQPTPATPAAPVTPVMEPPLALSKPIAMPAAAQPETPAQRPSAPPAVASAGAVLPVGLGELIPNWPPMVRMEIMQLGFSHAMVSLPAALVEESLRKGRAVFAWKQVRSWINSPGASAASAHDTELVELPLKVIAPLFLAKQRAARPQTRVAVDDKIPDLFSGPARGKSAAPAVAAAEPVTAPIPAPAPVTARQETIVFKDTEISGKARTTDNARSGTEFLKRYATPNDIVLKAASLEGVLGAVITLADGLLVASQLPPNLNGDSLAAFTPQLYARVSQSAREYRMGELKDLTFTVGNTTWKIFKVGSIFFAAFGNANQPLPGTELAALAAELDRKPKP